MWCFTGRVEETLHLTYVGPPAYAGALAQALEAEGLKAEYEPPFETKDLDTVLNFVAVVFAVTGPARDIIASARKFTARHKGSKIEGLPEEPRRTTQERIETLNDLLDKGRITPEERAEQRNRILREL